MDSESEDEVEQTEFSWQGSSGCVILINCYDPSKRGSAAVAYKATCEMIRTNMRKSTTGLIGICLYGTGDGQGSKYFENLVEIQPLAVPTLEHFNNMLSQDVSSYGQAKELSLTNVFWHCCRMFKKCKKRLGEKTVVMMTNLDTPPSNLNPKLEHQIIKRVVDLTELGIRMKVINVSEEKNKPHEFYKELLRASKCEGDIPAPIWDIGDMQQLMQQHTHRNLALAQITFDIGNDISFGVSVYKLVQPCRNPKTVKLQSSTNEIVIASNKPVKIYNESDDYDGSQLRDSTVENKKEVPALKSEILYYQTYANERIEFTHNELQMIKQPFPPRILKLLGFKPSHILCKEKWFLKQCQFLFPNESLVEGSTIAFRALHKACTELSTLPICVLCPRSSGKPKIVALSPCTKPLGLNIDVGFDIIFIPFIENLKDIPPNSNEGEEIQPNQKAFMKDMMTTLKFDLKADSFDNPKLQSLYRTIEALALQTTLEKFVDTTKRGEKIFENLDSEKFEELFGSFKAATKRPSGSNAASKVTAKKDKPEIDEDLFNRRINSGHIENYNVEELKRILKWKNPPGLPGLTGLLKKKLVELVYTHCSKQ